MDYKLSLKKYCQQFNKQYYQQFNTKYFQLVNIKYCQNFKKSTINSYNQ
jgi:ribosomal protein L33